MNELHLFAGTGGGILGGVLLGNTCSCAVEIEPYCRNVILQRQRDGMLPRFPIWDDVRTFDGTPWRGRINIVCGGFPCQDISIAGRGAGIEGNRSGLWKEMARITNEIRPDFVFVENSPLLIRRGLAVVIGDLAKMGFDSQWGVVSAEDSGAPHKRERLWLVGVNTDAGNATREARSRRTNVKDRTEKIKVWDRGIGQLVAERIAVRYDTYAESRRVLYGITNWVDRLAAIGNGQIPIVAKSAWEALQ